MEQKAIIEIGVEVTRLELEWVERYLKDNKIAYYIEPIGRFVSLEDLECQREGK